MENINNEKIAVIFVGVQASGKTTFYKNTFGMYTHINLDNLHTRNKEDKLLLECMENGISFVVDNTNPTKSNREKYISAAKKYGYTIKGYYFRSSITESVERNGLRTGKAQIPNCAIANTYNKLELPQYEEGFDELYYVCIKDGEFAVCKWENQ